MLFTEINIHIDEEEGKRWMGEKKHAKLVNS